MAHEFLNELKSIIRDTTLIKFSNCFLKLNDEIIFDDLFIRNGIIQNSKKLFFDEKVQPDIVINCLGAILSPGFIDIQINGGFGCDFSDLSSDLNVSLRSVGSKLVEYGVTAYCPTIVTSSPEVYHSILNTSIKAHKGEATAIGFHLEGPFISIEKSGMHNPLLINTDYGRDPIQTLKNMYGDDFTNIAYVTLAPEVRGSCQVIKYLIEKGISVSLGHSVASFDEGVKAIECGANILTHIFCSMLPFHHRDPHLIGLLTYDYPIPNSPSLYFGIITDLIHTHATAIRIAHRSHKNGLIVVTDANPAFGLKDGEYRFGTADIEVVNGSSYVKGTGVLAGATCSLDQCMRNYWHAAKTSRLEALNAVTSHPADALKIGDKKGRLNPGYDADLVMLDYETMEVISTWIGGHIVYHKPGRAFTVTHL